MHVPVIFNVLQEKIVWYALVQTGKQVVEDVEVSLVFTLMNYSTLLQEVVIDECWTHRIEN